MKINTLIPAALFAAACAFSYTAQAEEVTVKTETVRASDGTVVKEKKEVTTDKSDHRDGNWFTDFWVHKVGGTIGNGLKKGTHKVDRAFNGIGKDNDEPKRVESTKTETKTEVKSTPAPVVRSETTTKTETRTTEPAPLPVP